MAGVKNAMKDVRSVWGMVSVRNAEMIIGLIMELVLVGFVVIDVRSVLKGLVLVVLKDFICRIINVLSALKAALIAQITTNVKNANKILT